MLTYNKIKQESYTLIKKNRVLNAISYVGSQVCLIETILRVCLTVS
jgi:hypothetical protein